MEDALGMTTTLDQRRSVKDVVVSCVQTSSEITLVDSISLSSCRMSL